MPWVMDSHSALKNEKKDILQRLVLALRVNISQWYSGQKCGLPKGLTFSGAKKPRFV